MEQIQAVLPSPRGSTTKPRSTLKDGWVCLIPDIPPLWVVSGVKSIYQPILELDNFSLSLTVG